MRKTLAPVPADRFATMAELSVTLDDLLAGSGGRTRQVPGRTLAVADAVLVLLLVAG